ncbi:STE STE20 YSK kinase [Fusarium phyllophilum]|uniref:non-specific serine/threonine protein kinase n=1 Tax=Fusarium phyllophilum TaxID=47803 RepID=A0A8H5MX74_9HYPO|nr:STE STE20 YSK kinase [Fusarium phyllophilum]
MATLGANSLYLSATKQNAVQDAREMQDYVVKECGESGKEPPPYSLSELIGKGSFGRVYKARGIKSGQLVAVKIINIDNGDALDPGADTFSDILKEVETLKFLGSGGAKNVNTVLDVLLVGHNIWMVTEYCAGGSVSTLMKPSGYLPEQWIIPILREVAEAIYWVHRQGIIHRDIKCANVLVTEAGGVQLCDFGVAGLMETKFDKRSTVTGSLHWMAPELFNPTVKYGTEVDIWAFGSMAYEVASGLPPNANFRDISRFGTYLKHHCPRLQGDRYSPGLKDLIACCLVENAAQRPPIQEIQQHPYIFDTEAKYPTLSLSKLHRRQFRISHSFRIRFILLFETYDAPAELWAQPPNPPPYRRRQPPANMKMPKAPLEKLFDPNTITNYQDNARSFYMTQRPIPTPSDLPLRDHSEPPTVRESLIDLDAALGNTLSQSADLSTIRPKTRSLSIDEAVSDRRRTLEWTFPTGMPTSASPQLSYGPESCHGEAELTMVPARTDSAAENALTPGASQSRASALSLIDLDDSLPDGLAVTAPDNRVSNVSLIDLDASLHLGLGDTVSTRPSTANSDAPSTTSEWRMPFELERHAFEPISHSPTIREPSIYIESGDFDASTLARMEDEANQDMLLDIRETNQQGLPSVQGENARQNGIPAFSLPSLPTPPTADVMLGRGSAEDVKDELLRLVSSFEDHLGMGSQMIESLPIRQGHVVPRE